MRMRIRNPSPKADVLNLKRRAYHKCKYSSLSPNCRPKQALQPTKSIRKNQRRHMPPSSQWIDESDNEEPPHTSGNANYSRANFNNYDEDEVDLPTVERPYSKILSFQKQQRAVAQTPEYQEDVTVYSSSNRSLTKAQEKKSNHKSGDTKREKTPVPLRSSVHDTMPAGSGSGSKNLAFLRQQLVGQLKLKDTGESMFETWSERESRINKCKGLRRAESGSGVLSQSSERRTELQATTNCTPKSDDFEITNFQNNPDELYEIEWELVEELINSDNHGVEINEDSAARCSNDLHRQEEEIEFIYQNMYPEDRIYVLENLIENYTGSLIFSDDMIGNLI